MLCLAITGFDADPERVSELLNLQPTYAARKGMASGSGRAHRSNGWWLDAHCAELTNGGTHGTALNLLIERLRDSAQRFQRLREEVKPESVTIYGGFYHTPGEQSGVWLDPDQMRVLSDCEIGWGLDIFVNEDGPERLQKS
ncbi:MAG TPA: DUF4279 domain-containing protein [Roseiarcus sp.]